MMEKLRVKNGIDRLDKYGSLFEGKRLGLVTNPTGVDRNLRSTVDILSKSFKLEALFSPEHGVRGNIQAGEAVSDYMDPETGIPVHSLYGENKKPSPELLDGVDSLVFDIQDIGSRYYTFTYTMAYCMEACAEAGKPFAVFDRINPVGGTAVEGNLLDPAFRSFVGRFPIAIRHGLTLGELAMLINSEFGIHCRLEVVRLEGWKREACFDDTDLPWVNPTPNMPSPETTFIYNGTCLFEGTNVSEGRGTTKPFEVIGAPWIDPYRLADRMNGMNLEGVLFRPAFFSPVFSKYSGEQCGGVQLHITDRHAFKPVECGVHLIYDIMDKYPDRFEWLKPEISGKHYFIDLLAGTDQLRKRDSGAAALIGKWRHDSKAFTDLKKRYHLYDSL